MSSISDTADVSARTTLHLATEIAVGQSTDLMRALVAGYALMAHADGEVASAERRRLFAFVRDYLTLSTVSRDEIAEEAAVHEANFRMDPELAQQMARETLSLVAGQPRAARLVVAACRDLIQADGIAHPSEFRMLAEIKAQLGVTDPIHRAPSATSQETIR